MALSSQTASASSLPSSSAPRSKHDVFLSFRGVDTRKGIVAYLYHELQNRGIQTFMDDQGLQRGMPIAPSLLDAIEDSRFAVVLLSPNYASSTWCLDELTNILQCSETNKTPVVPIFYYVDPSDVRYQRGVFAEAFTKHEEKFSHSHDDIEKVNKWRAALTKVANLSGLDLNNFESERELVQCIVELVCSNVRPIFLSSGDFESFEATRQAMVELMKALQNDEVVGIGVYGMGGVGKTTMVKHVGIQARGIGLFRHVIMAVVSQNPDLKRIQGTLADLLGLKLEEESEIGRASRLYKEVLRRNKVLIILDDMWDMIDLSGIGIPSYSELWRCNSKVLLTTRRVNVCHTMETQANIQLSLLSEEDAWNLFVKKARKSFEKSTSFYDVARRVARECAGLPIALIAVARALGDKDFEEWREAARHLEMSQRANLDQRDVFNCIKLSYDYLEGHNAKSCFLLCCLFPEDYDIQLEDLMLYGFGTGLFREVNSTIENARVVASSVTKYLKASCLLLDGAKHGCVRMHDVIRDMAMSIALSVDGLAYLVKPRCDLQDWPIDAHDGYSAISLMESNICRLPNKLVCPKLQILLLQRNADIRKIPKTFFERPNDLRVLDLRGTKILSLSPSFSLLTRLQTLHLDNCGSMVDISMLRKLKNLEILSMRNCHFEKFPRQIENLTNLRMLDMTGNVLRTVPSQVISRLHRLEELYMQCNFGAWGGKIERGLFCSLVRNAAFDELTGLSRLNNLEVSISGVECIPQHVEFHPNWVNFDICISRHESARGPRIPSPQIDFPHHRSRALTLNTTMNTLPDWFIFVVTEKTEELWYTDCNGLSNILEEHDHGRLHGLKYLSIDVTGRQYKLKVLLNTITWSRVSDEPVFENLETLYVSVHCLKELCVGELPAGSLRNLKTLKVESGDMVEPLLRSNLLHKLQSLEILHCCFMNKMEYVFGFEEHKPQQVILTKLRVVLLRYVHNLINIWSGPPPHGMFNSLKIFYFSDCRKLMYLFTSNVARCLLQLEDLWVESCPKLERLIEASEETDSNKIVFPQLKNLVLRQLPELTRLSFTGSNTIDIGIECPTLEHLYIDECPQFSVSASQFHYSNHVQLNDHRHSYTLQESILRPQFRHSWYVILSLNTVTLTCSLRSDLFKEMKNVFSGFCISHLWDESMAIIEGELSP